ncbi:MAG: fused MFS/spermidine synthase [Phycisphaerales bacterium]|nr:fused MFS/spermidine synthase [Phycisphaerales bacterium]
MPPEAPTKEPSAPKARIDQRTEFAAAHRSLGARGIPVSFRTVVYASTFLSGAAALTFQVVWQRYLSFLVGSEARSICLIVAVFLFGLAAGYRFWGNLTERQWSRQTVLKALGFVELAIAGYGLVFPEYFAIVKSLTYSGPDWLLFDLAMTALLLLPPTFLMGASIPMLTSALPTDAGEVNYCHSRIYGINTLGAFLGAMVAGFYLVPGFGLRMSLVFASVLCLLVGLVFVSNPLAGPSHKAQDIPRIPNAFGSPGIYLFVFTTGAVSISLEVLFTRVLSLTIGSSHYVFPIVVGVVILGLAIGSLSLRRSRIPHIRVHRELVKLSIYLAVIYLTVPFWPYWVSHVRVSLATIPTNFAVYMFLIVLFVSAWLLPLMIPMGRLLPLGYALIDKGGNDYGKICGRVYAMNTLGTVAGAVGIGYLLFFWLNLPAIFKLNIALLLGVAGILCLRSGWRGRAASCALAALVVFLLPDWNRLSHVVGLFRNHLVQPFHFHGVFAVPFFNVDVEVLSLRDDPTQTVCAYALEQFDERLGVVMNSRTISVNAKSDGNTIGDYSNMMLSGVIPYLLAPKEANLDAAVVGLGTGITSGSLAACPEVDRVTTLEISPGVIEAVHHFSDANFNLASNPKSRIVETDAFRFFARKQEKFDVIASEPSNPWVVGVENLFTPEFYRMVTDSLNPGGVFFQWIQIYEIDDEIFTAIASNLTREFEHVSLFVIGPLDVGVIASHQPLDTRNLERRLAQPMVQTMLRPVNLDHAAVLWAMEALRTRQLIAIGNSSRRPRHGVEFPWLGHAAGRVSFVRGVLDLNQLQNQDFLARHLAYDPARAVAVEQWMQQHAATLGTRCQPSPDRHSDEFLCLLLQDIATLRFQLSQPSTVQNAAEKITAYGRLRDKGLIAQDMHMLSGLHQLLRDALGRTPSKTLQPIVGQLLSEYLLELQWDLALNSVAEFHQLGVFSAEAKETYLSHLDELRATAARYFGGSAH